MTKTRVRLSGLSSKIRFKSWLDPQLMSKIQRFWSLLEERSEFLAISAKEETGYTEKRIESVERMCVMILSAQSESVSDAAGKIRSGEVAAAAADARRSE